MCFRFQSVLFLLAFVLVPVVGSGGDPAVAYGQQAKVDDCRVKSRRVAIVAKVISGHSVVLDDGTEVRLVSILSPRGDGANGENKHALSKLVLGKKIELGFGGRQRDRYGRLLAHVYLLRAGERLWVQRILLERGLAQVASFADNRACVRLLQVFEEEARRERRGYWGARIFQVREAEQTGRLLGDLNRFQIVEGVIKKVADVRGRIFLNFSADWRTDFTATIAKKYRRVFAKAKMDLKLLEGKRVRVRGWVESWNGPVIKVTHPEQIEIVDGAVIILEKESRKKKNPVKPVGVTPDLSEI